MPTPINPRLLSWAGDDLETQAREQAERTSRLPFVEGHVALMPDAHYGMGATIGSVIPTRGAVIPAAVGVDIGCGMIAACLPLTSQDLPDNLDGLHQRISTAVPAGLGRAHENRQGDSVWDIVGRDIHTELTGPQETKVQNQLGTLGGGNHFVEVCLDDRDRVWVVLHSGSRGIGKELAETHIAIAKGLMKQWFINLEDPDLAYLVQGTPEFDAYIRDMLWAQAYATANREAMMDNVLDAVNLELGRDLRPEQRINCHHNFTQQEHHHGKNVWVTRKGAIKAGVSDWGVIPGSMGTRSYIVSGKGSEASFQSCSHGAGRRMSRGQARRELDLDGLRESMVGKAWNDGQAKDLIDEDPRAYKDIDVVMERQSDLVTVHAVLRQVLNYKGVA